MFAVLYTIAHYLRFYIYRPIRNRCRDDALQYRLYVNYGLSTQWYTHATLAFNVHPRTVLEMIADSVLSGDNIHRSTLFNRLRPLLSVNDRGWLAAQEHLNHLDHYVNPRDHVNYKMPEERQYSLYYVLRNAVSLPGELRCEISYNADIREYMLTAYPVNGTGYRQVAKIAVYQVPDRFILQTRRHLSALKIQVWWRRIISCPKYEICHKLQLQRFAK